MAVLLAALTQACTDTASPKRVSPTAENTQPSKDAASAVAVATTECATPSSSWIFCDDFESDRLAQYFEYDNGGGTFMRATGAGVGNSVGMRATFTQGQAPAGRLSLAFGKEPSTYFKTVDAGVANYREIYWRFYVLRNAGWVGNGPGALTHATIFATANWSQAMVAYGWSDDTDPRYLRLDSFSGTDAGGNLVTTGFNDAAHLRALGTVRSAATEDDQAHAGQWACYEFHIKLNDAGQSNGVYELSVNGQLSAQKTGLNWVGAYNAFGINSLNLEQFGSAAPAANVRTLDNFVVSTAPIGCGTTSGTGAVATIAVALDSTSLAVPHQGHATATMRDASGTVVAGTPTWSSANPTVATVSSTGVVTAVAPGQAYVLAWSNGHLGAALVTIYPAPGSVPVAAVGVSLASSSIAAGATTQATASTFDAGGNTLTGRTVSWTSANPTVAGVSATGLVTGMSTGQAYILATSEGKTGWALVTVATSQTPVASVSVSLGASSIAPGATTQATATTRDANNNVITGRAVAWSSTNPTVATVSAGGVVTGAAAGQAYIVATSEGKTGSAVLTVAAQQVPVATVSVALAASSLAPNATTQATATTRDASNNVLTGRVVTWSSSNTTVATVSTTGVVTAKVAGSANIVATSEGKTGQATLMVTVGNNPTVLFEEKFEDGSLGGRGWYDMYNTGPASLSTDHISGSTHSLQVNFVQGQTAPSPNTSARHLFTASNSVYLRYWVKYSTNWVGSGQTYHPHEFHFLTNEETDYAGLSSDFLTMYIEQNWQAAGGTAVLQSQDARNIDATRIGQDLTNVTESRAVSGCNGDPDGTAGACYSSGGWFNGRSWRSPQPVFMPNPGAGYKADWHEVEVYFQLNSIVGGKGQRDGVAQYWFDGRLVIDRHDIYLRTGTHPNMKFNQFIMAPYIGDGSPINQTIWYDDLIVQTARPTP